jgi:hypothetical protein
MGNSTLHSSENTDGRACAFHTRCLVGLDSDLTIGGDER